MIHRRALAVAFLIGFAGSTARAQARTDSTARAPSYRSRLLGVYDAMSGEPIAGVEVTDMLTGLTALTTKTGTVTLSFLPDGGSLVTVRKVGYAAQTMTVPINPKDTVPITVVFEHVAELQKVMVKADSTPYHISPGLRGFEERRKAGFGYFIDERTLRKEDGRPLGNVLVAHVPGAQVKQASGNAAFLLKSPRCINGGQPDVYLDGVALAHVPDKRWTGTTQTTALGAQRRARANDASEDPSLYPIDLSQFQVSDIAGVEFYPDGATLPIDFNHTSAGCGALLLWSRER